MTAYADTSYEQITWRQAAKLFIRDMDLETGKFQKAAGTFSVILRTFVARFGIGTSMYLMCNDLVNFVPVLNVATAGPTIADNFIGYPLAIFTAFAVFRIASIRRKVNRMIRHKNRR